MMFFLFRCLFWLGLVFSHIAGQEGFNAAALFGAHAPIASQSAASLGRLALEAASRQCRAEPEKCLALAARVSRLAPQSAGANANSSRDTLNAGDRAPTWRLRPGAASDSAKHG